MSHREAFRSLLESLCQSQGWRLDANGVEIACAEDRRQRVEIQDLDFEGQPLLRLHSVVGDSTHIEPMRLIGALRLNWKLPHGALALRGDDLVIVDTLHAVEADVEETEATLRYLPRPPTASSATSSTSTNTDRPPPGDGNGAQA